MLRYATLLSLFVHLVSTAATQTAYGASFSALRWISLFAVTAFGLLNWLTSGRGAARMQSVNARVLLYLALWAVTVIDADYPLFSSYRWIAHAMIVVSALVFIPGALRAADASRVLLTLKLIVIVILIASYFWPAPLTAMDDAGLYRGIFGNANALGHMAAVGLLLFMHGMLTGSRRSWTFVQGLAAALAGILLIQSGARSSIMAFLAGFAVFFLLYRAQLYRTQISRYVILLVVGIIPVFLAVPDVQERIGTLLFKHDDDAQSRTTLERLTSSRQLAWEKHWEGFKERPVLGWGFGLDSDSDLSDWHGEWTALGVIGRDPVNDVMYTLESGGIVGLFAYILIMALVFKGWIPANLRRLIDARLRLPIHRSLVPAYEAQKIFLCLTVSLIVLFEFDNTALAAGNFFADLVWVSLGLTMGLQMILMQSLRSVAPMRSAEGRFSVPLPGE